MNCTMSDRPFCSFHMTLNRVNCLLCVLTPDFATFGFEEESGSDPAGRFKGPPPAAADRCMATVSEAFSFDKAFRAPRAAGIGACCLRDRNPIVNLTPSGPRV